jgi:hypothetical protein
MAGVFEQVSSRRDVRAEVERAVVLCAHFLPRKNINMGFVMMRRWEEIHDDIPFSDFHRLISLMNMYLQFWPSDKPAADLKNERKIAWYGDY